MDWNFFLWGDFYAGFRHMREASVMPFLAVEGLLLHLFMSFVPFYALMACLDLLLNSFFLVWSE
jgi:hypothetical protein